ncbi:hypothetical protein [Streptomyces alkaliterrae]|uniref:Uncharacterized protein n=1 Tax=Streptomyces alkaliterrae TaxID=2213162 RepID=A0A5P0YQ80_9ACTN|nr:hypothetical protein [Streptomyces alkaliterrae]MBB1259384.1 hypothetical protein [Streptomyces alkaliterrae]MQS01767.1 hypothetical protein [Streptomyces alkaliterrae]
METAVDDELTRRNPLPHPGCWKEGAAERQIVTVAKVDALAEVLELRWRGCDDLPALALEWQQEVAGGLDDLVRAARVEAKETPSGADLARDA